MQLNLVGLFLLRAVVWFAAWLFVWYHLGSLITLPVSIVTKSVVALFFPSWAEGVEQSEATLTLLTSLAVPGMVGVPTGQVAVFSPEVGFLKYGYGLPLLTALLFASDARYLFTKVAIGAVALLPFQVLGVCFDWLKQLAIETEAVSFSPMAREFIAFGYQFANLVLPALVPVLLWAVMDQRFLVSFLMEATLVEGSVSDSGCPKGR